MPNHIIPFPDRQPDPNCGPFHDDIERQFLANWEEFKRRADSAYEWRDHECLDGLLEIIGALRPWICRPAPGQATKDDEQSQETAKPSNVLDFNQYLKDRKVDSTPEE